MTIQNDDAIIMNHEKFEIFRSKGKGLFEPIKYGLNPVSEFSGCWRGYVLTYEIQDNQLLLQKMVHGYHNDEALIAEESKIPLFGKPPKLLTGGVRCLYDDINAFIPFTGGMIISRGSVLTRHELYHEMLDELFYSHEVYELRFKEGIVSTIFPLSEEVEQVRSQFPYVLHWPFDEDYTPTNDELLELWKAHPIHYKEINQAIIDLFSIDYWTWSGQQE